MSEELILNKIEENKEDYIKFFQELVQADSYNPPGNEKNVAIKIEEYLKDANVHCEIFPFGDNRANLMAYLNDNFEGKNLLYNGHMDVVPPGTESEWNKPPLSGYIKRNKVMFGRGTADMKGGLAAMVIALKILKELNLEINGNLIFNAVADEEKGGDLGTGWCVENVLKTRSIKSDFAVISEPSGIRPFPKAIILGEKGHLQLKIITNGISCHSSTPFMGKNAIYMMSEIIQNLDKFDEYIPKIEPPMSIERIKELIATVFPSREDFERVLKEQPLLGGVLKALNQFTKSINMINGGIKENVIPDRCEAVMDIRLLPGQQSEIIIDALKKYIEELGYEIRDQQTGKPEDVFVSLEIVHQSEGSYWAEWEKSSDLKDFFSSVEKVYGKKPFYFFFPASADAHYLRNTAYCPATILFGPGSASTAHSINESIEIQDYINSIKVFALFALNFLKKV
jgi:succinyl-diaminopimelate desuccinylase